MAGYVGNDAYQHFSDAAAFARSYSTAKENAPIAKALEMMALGQMKLSLGLSQTYSLLDQIQMQLERQGRR